MYRIYGDNNGYKLITIVQTEEQVQEYLQLEEYCSILVIEHTKVGDFPYALVNPKRKVKIKKYE